MKSKSITIILILFSLNACVRMRHFHITLSEDCIAQKIEEFKQENLKVSATKEKSYLLKYNNMLGIKTDHSYAVSFDIGTISFDKELKVSFIRADKIEKDEELQQIQIEKIEALVEKINIDKKIDIELNKYFELSCFSSGNVPQFAQYQDFTFSVDLDDPMFLSALTYYLYKEKFILLKQ